jgi:hypothetical protein
MTMIQGQLTGSAIREHRQRLGIRQAELARRVGISASYFNQIEHNRRKIGGKLLSDIATALQVDPSLLAEGANARLIGLLRDAQTSEQRLIEGFDAPEAFVSRFPGWARLLVARHKRVVTLEQRVETLTDRLAHDRQLGDAFHELLSTVTAIRSSASILLEEKPLEPVWRDRFERNIIEDSARLARGAQALVDYLDVDAVQIGGASSPWDDLEAFLEDNAYHFPAVETGGADAINQIVASAGRLKSPEANAMARDHLHRYLQDALRLPLSTIAPAVARYGIDPLAIAQDCNVDLATTLRRLAAMPQAMLPGPVGLAICDASGAIVLRKQVEEFSLLRHGTACPRLPLFQSLSHPLRPMRRVLQQDNREGGTVLTYTIAEPVGDLGFDEDLMLRAHMLIVPQSRHNLEKDPQLPVHSVGLTCRSCEIDSCSSRREPSILSNGPRRRTAGWTATLSAVTRSRQ